MADVFLSYSSTDRDLAVKVATLLSDSGISVWYDDALGTGQAYRAAIQRAIDSAIVVLVLWTVDAVKSAWVKDEAANGWRRGALFSVVCGGASVPSHFRRSIFGRIRIPENGPTSSEMSNLAYGISHVIASAQSQDRPSANRLLARLADFASTSIIYAIITAAFLSATDITKPPPTLSQLSVTSTILISGIIGLALGGVGYASSRLLEHAATRVFSINTGPSVGRLLYRWTGEALGCALLLFAVLAAKGTSYFDHPALLNVVMFFMGLGLVWLVFMAALAAKYSLFLACRRCRYFLLM